jgi:SAM-dependent methyltransferase
MSSGTSQTSSLKKFIKGIPVLGATAARLSQLPIFARARRLAFQGSGPFWEAVYREGGTSGPGSYGRLAEFKAEILNEFVRTRNIRTVIEFGCGDGAQLALARYPEYVGVDVATASIERCSSLFAHDATKRFYLSDKLPEHVGMFDLALSLDVIYHLVEDRVFDAYMRRLFDVSQRYVIIYASNYDAVTQASHVRHRKFTAWIEKNAPDWRTDGVVPNRFPFDSKQPEETSCADFCFFVHQLR